MMNILYRITSNDAPQVNSDTQNTVPTWKKTAFWDICAFI